MQDIFKLFSKHFSTWFSVTYNKRADFTLLDCLNFGYCNKALLTIAEKNSVRKAF